MFESRNNPFKENNRREGVRDEEPPQLAGSPLYPFAEEKPPMYSWMPTPPCDPKEFQGQVKEGNDGNMYKSVLNEKWGWQWEKQVRRPLWA